MKKKGVLQIINFDFIFSCLSWNSINWKRVTNFIFIVEINMASKPKPRVLIVCGLPGLW